MKKIQLFLTAIIVWAILSATSLGYSGGTGEPNNPYQIADVNDLLEFSTDTGNYDRSFILTADIDLDWNLPGGQIFTSAIVAADTSTSEGFQGTALTGTFDGNGRVIRNAYIHSDGDYTGVFGYLGYYGKIRNLGVVNTSVQGSDYVGGLVGYTISSITNCYFDGTVSVFDIRLLYKKKTKHIY